MLDYSKTVGHGGIQLETRNTYGLPDNWNKKFYPVYLKSSTDKTYPLAPATNGTKNAFKEVSISNEEIDGCGNVGRATTETKDNATNKIYTKITNSHYKPSSGSCFHKSRLDYATVNSTATGETSLPDRKSSFTYTSKGQIETETIHDMDGKGLDLSLTTTYQYDAYGNIIKKSLAGNGLSNRYTSTEYDHHSTDLKRGRFATKTTNALGQFDTKKYDTRFGTVTSIIGPNGLETRKRYNAFGQKYLDIPPNNNWVLTQYSWVNGEKNQSFTE